MHLIVQEIKDHF